ncbi:MAG: Zn-ribbon domain-containing OB-fold protein [Candidatus Binatia bacterium]
MPRVALREGLLSTIEPDAEPRLLAARCPRCARLHFPATGDCPYCSSAGCEPTPVGPGATIDVFTVVERAPPGYRGAVPYGFGVVALPEGLLIVTRFLPAAIARLEAGQPAHLVLEDLYVDDAGATVVGFAFAPEAAA